MAARRPSFQMRQVTDAAFALMRLERAVEHRQMLWLRPLERFSHFPARLRWCRIFNMRDDGGNFLLGITKSAQRIGHAAINDFQHAAAGEQFVFHERNVGFHAGGVAVHQERDRAGGREHGDLALR